MVGLLPYQVDTAFWSPPAAADGDAAVISSAGLEYRDYPTLIEAARGEPLQAVIAAGSRWSKHRNSSRGIDLPGNVAVTSLNYLGLRELYARSRFVVMPLRETDNQAGITTILEAMAMGRAVIVSATRGQRDVVRGRLVEADGVTGRVIGGPAGFGIARPLAEEETGLYVPPGDPAALRTAIRYLLDRPDEAERLGAAGRRLVATEMNLDLYVRRIAGWMRGTAAEACATAGAESPAPVSVQRDPEGART
jgi:glycosyltransferase involved in cell wall biosynthesis